MGTPVTQAALDALAARLDASIALANVNVIAPFPIFSRSGPLLLA
jgi:hypothetical protein